MGVSCGTSEGKSIQERKHRCKVAEAGAGWVGSIAAGAVGAG